MTTTTTMDGQDNVIHEKPGAQLAAHRVLKEYSQEYVAGKLHLRVRIIELLEADDYLNMPEAVFVKGYLRAYAKLLSVPAEPLLLAFHQHYACEKKPEKTLWQSRKQSNRMERGLRWITMGGSLVVLVAVGMWWESSRQELPGLSANLNESKQVGAEASEEVKFKDLSKMRSLLSSDPSKTAEPALGAESATPAVEAKAGAELRAGVDPKTTQESVVLPQPNLEPQFAAGPKGDSEAQGG